MEVFVVYGFIETPFLISNKDDTTSRYGSALSISRVFAALPNPGAVPCRGNGDTLDNRGTTGPSGKRTTSGRVGDCMESVEEECSRERGCNLEGYCHRRRQIRRPPATTARNAALRARWNGSRRYRGVVAKEDWQAGGRSPENG